MRGSYNANFDEWQSDWFKIDRTTTGISTENPSDTGGGGVAAGRVSGQMGTDEVIVGTEIFTDNMSANGTLGVVGVTTLSGGLNNESFLIQTITDVTNSSGSSYDVADTDHMIFNPGSGASGTATINLPPARDNEGRLLRFKSDSTISSTTNITLSPDGSDTIDGEADFNFNRDYDGVMLLAHNDNWYIIQRKSK